MQSHFRGAILRLYLQDLNQTDNPLDSGVALFQHRLPALAYQYSHAEEYSVPPHKRP